MPNLNISGGIFDLEKFKNEIAKLEEQTTQEGFYSDPQKAQTVFDEIKKKKYWIDAVENASQLKTDISDLFDMLSEEEEESKDIIKEI